MAPRVRAVILVAGLVATAAACTSPPTSASSPATGGGSATTEPAWPIVSGSAPPTSSPPTADARWTALATSPVANQTGFLNIWTGTELLVCCGAPNQVSDSGSPPSPTAAAFNPATNTWRPITAPPTDVQSWGSVTVIGNTVYLLDGGTAPWAYEAYDIGADSWRALPPPPENAGRAPDSHLGPAAWSGHEIFTVLATNPSSDHDLAVLALDPATDTWRTLPAPPVRLEPTSLTFDDGTLTLLGQQRSPADQHVDVLSTTFDTTSNTWHPAQATGLNRRDPVAIGGGSHVVVWDVTGHVRVRDGDEWRDEPTIPFPEDECGWKGAQVDDKLVLWRCTQQGAVLDTSTGAWAALPLPPTDLLGENIVSLGDRLVLWARDTDRLQPYRLDLN